MSNTKASKNTGADSRRIARFSEQNGKGGRLGDADGDTDPAALLGKVGLLEKDLERRQESYVSRERAYKTRIDELEEELLAMRQSKTGWMKEDVKMGNLKNMQQVRAAWLYIYLCASLCISVRLCVSLCISACVSPH